MSKRFMIIKPKPCCGNSDYIGYVGNAKKEKSIESICCEFCKAVYINEAVLMDDDGDFVRLDRIVWLPYEQDIITHDTRIEEKA